MGNMLAQAAHLAVYHNLTRYTIVVQISILCNNDIIQSHNCTCLTAKLCNFIAINLYDIIKIDELQARNINSISLTVCQSNDMIVLNSSCRTIAQAIAVLCSK